MKPLVITAAIVGAETMRSDNPNIPYLPEEIATEAEKCSQNGASMVHVHGRLADGTPTQDRNTFGQILSKIRDRSDVLVQFSTGGAVGMSVAERIEAIDLRPEMATLTTGSVNFGDECFLNTFPMIVEIAEGLKKHKIRPEIEVFDSAMIGTALRLEKMGLLEGPLHFDFVMGMPGGIAGTEAALLFLISQIPNDATWSVAGLGRFEFPLAKLAIQLGGHVRVGLEDNIYLAKGVLAAGSWELVEKISEFSKAFNRDVSTPEQARNILSIQ